MKKSLLSLNNQGARYRSVPLRRSSRIFSTMVFVCFAAAVFAQLKDPVSHPKFVNPLPNPSVIDVTGGGSYVMKIAPSVQWLGLVDASNNPLNTNVWGYGLNNNTPTYPGPTFVAMKDVPVKVKWENHLPNNHLLPIDESIHIAHPHSWLGNGVPIVTHLHGGHTEAASDGHPDAWYTSNYAYKGHEFVKKVYDYANDQEAATLWYHDHALGITRLNVYAGLAGFYLLRDANEQGLGLPSGAYEQGIVFQDRNFSPDGQLTRGAGEGGHGGGESQGDCQIGSGGGPFIYEEPIIPNTPIEPIPEHSISAEFFGEYMLVNGMTWPYMRVEERQYRFRLLNGSDSRFYYLVLKNADGDPVPFLQIGTDDGLLPHPVTVDSLLMGPGERADVIVDFAGLSGTTLTLFNYGPDGPFADLEDLDFDESRTTAQLMQFRVDLPLNVNIPTTSFTTASELRPAIAEYTTPANIRKLVLFEGRDQYCRLRPQLGILDENSALNGSLMWDEAITETPGLNTVEYWDIYNTTADAHPMHLHLVSFQILGRTTFDGTVTFTETGDPISGGSKQILALNAPVSFPAGWNAPDNEKGWKDTGIIPPGGVMRIAARYDRPGKYVWHCHILSHEDHEMMRQFQVGPQTIEFSGEILWEHDDASGVNNATVNLTGSATGSDLTDVLGDYLITTNVTSGNFTLKPVKNINKFNGVTAADATAIQQHVAAVNPITDPYRLVCADVNKNNTVNTLDASLITQSLLGNPAANAQFNTSWRFVPKSHVMTNPPWGFPEQKTYTALTHPQHNQDFIGMKIGDVAATFANPANFGAGKSLVLRVPDRVLQAGESVSVPFSADQLEDLAAFQFALTFDPGALQFEAVESGATGLPFSADHFGAYNTAVGELRAVWSQASGMRIEEASQLFRLRFKALHSGVRLSEILRLDDSILPAYAYSGQLTESAVELYFDVATGTSDPTASGAQLRLQARPNPFRESTTVSFSLPAAGEVQLRVLDASGRELLRMNKSCAAGNNAETLQLGGLSAPGVLYCELTTPFGVVVQKMAVLK